MRETPNPSPIAFVPRQVMLEKHANELPAMENATKKKEKKKKQKKSTPETMELVRSDAHFLTLRKEKARKVLLRSIAAYLERSGLSKALSAFRAEAQLEADDGNAYHLELEEVTFSVLESSDYDTKCSIGWSEEQGSERNGVVKRDQEDNVHKSEGKIMLEESTVETKDERRKNKSISYSSEENAQEVPKKVSCDEEHVMKSSVAGKDKRKEHKMAIDQVDENTAIKDHGIIQDICKEKMEVSNEKKRYEKKKKSKEASNSITENRGGNIDSVAVQASVQNPSEDIDAEKKDKKKKRDKPTSTAPEEVVGGTSCKAGREHLTEEKGDSRNYASQQLNDLVLDGSIDAIEKKVSKKRRRLPSGETGLQDDNGTVIAESRQKKLDSGENKESGIVQKGDAILSGGAHKKRKIEKEKDNANGFLEKSPGDLVSLSVSKDDNGTPDQKKETGNELVNGTLVNSVKGDESSGKGIKKGKRSPEPKTAQPFQRVKIDEVKFADDRLKDNSYWAKDGADIGYGAKAQGVLGQVKGRDFRHEKTKKKRGSYRGGQIDLQSHSIKFNYSDDE